MNILIIEDNKNLSQSIRYCLEPQYAVQQAFDGEEGLRFAREGIFDLIILDIMLPVLDGYRVLERLREDKVYTPVLILTSLRTTDDKLRGFQLGADDFLTKPFVKDELVCRVEAILKRTLGLYDRKRFVFGELELYPDTRKACIGQETLDLKGREYDVLEYLVSKKGHLVSKSQIFDRVWGFMSDTSTNVVEVYVSSVRKRLKPYGYDAYLKTVRGVGYLLDAEDLD